jgi:hypothetical protein
MPLQTLKRALRPSSRNYHCCCCRCLSVVATFSLALALWLWLWLCALVAPTFGSGAQSCQPQLPAPSLVTAATFSAAAVALPARSSAVFSAPPHHPHRDTLLCRRTTCIYQLGLHLPGCVALLLSSVFDCPACFRGARQRGAHRCAESLPPVPGAACRSKVVPPPPPPAPAVLPTPPAQAPHQTCCSRRTTPLPSASRKVSQDNTTLDYAAYGSCSRLTPDRYCPQQQVLPIA